MLKVLFLSALIFFATVSSANAACSIGNAAGAWRLFAASTDYGGFARGTLKINKTGGILGKGSALILQSGQKVNITGGSVTLSSACLMKGKIKTNVGVIITIIDSQMDIPKANVSGVWTQSDGDKGLFMLTKK